MSASFFVRYNTTTGKITNSGSMDSTFVEREQAAGGTIPTTTYITDFTANSVNIATQTLVTVAVVAPALTQIQLQDYLSMLQQESLLCGITVNVNAGVEGADVLNILCDGTDRTLSTLGLYSNVGQIDPTVTRTWWDNMNNATVLTGAQLVALAHTVIAWVNNVYAVSGPALASIAAGTTTTYEQLQALVWPTA